MLQQLSSQTASIDSNQLLGCADHVQLNEQDHSAGEDLVMRQSGLTIRAIETESALCMARFARHGVLKFDTLLSIVLLLHNALPIRLSLHM